MSKPENTGAWKVYENCDTIEGLEKYLSYNKNELHSICVMSDEFGADMDIRYMAEPPDYFEFNEPCGLQLIEILEKYYPRGVFYWVIILDDGVDASSFEEFKRHADIPFTLEIRRK